MTSLILGKLGFQLCCKITGVRDGIDSWALGVSSFSANPRWRSSHSVLALGSELGILRAEPQIWASKGWGMPEQAPRNTENRELRPLGMVPCGGAALNPLDKFLHWAGGPGQCLGWWVKGWNFSCRGSWRAMLCGGERLRWSITTGPEKPCRGLMPVCTCSCSHLSSRELLSSQMSPGWR